MLMVEKMPPSTTDSLIPGRALSTVRLSSIEDCYSCSGLASSIVKFVILGERKVAPSELSSRSQSVELRKS
jgi:hypothetical protein